MLRCRVVWICVGVLLLACSWPASAPAGELLGFFNGPLLRRVPDYLGNPRQLSAPRPSPHMVPEYNVNAPWYGYGFGVPTYHWGYFGARYRPATVAHKGYHDDFTQWGYRRGY